MNKVMLLGRLTREPEVRYTQTNTMVTSFGLAVPRRFTANNSNQPTADFINITAWGKSAEFASKYFKKGMQVAITGRFQSNTWEDSQGNKRTTIDVVAEELDFAEAKRDNYTEGNTMINELNEPNEPNPFDDIPEVIGDITTLEDGDSGIQDDVNL